MPPENQLLKLYDYWRVLTEGERDAIHASDWIRVAEFQAEKERLQEQIMQAGEQAASAVGAPDLLPRYRTVGEKLIVLEQANAEALAAKRRLAEQEHEELEESRRHLHQLHRAYAPGREPAWESYT